MTSFLILNKEFLDGHTDRSDMVASMHQEITKILVVGSMRWHVFSGQWDGSVISKGMMMIAV